MTRKARAGLAVAVLGLMATVGCSPSDDPEPDAAAAGDARIPLSRHLDILVVNTQGGDSLAFRGDLAASVGVMIKRLLAPPDKRPVRDLHFGVVSSKIDMAQICSGREMVPHDGTLLVPFSSSPRPSFKYGEGWPWPPTWRYLTAEMAEAADLPALAFFYAARFPHDGAECSVTQFMESAYRAIDGRNKGFIRQSSLLLILMLADREDCSTRDPTLWELTLGWTKQYKANARCYYPPPGLLHSVDHYVTGFASAHPKGRTMVAVAGMEGKPELEGGPPGPWYAKAYCRSKIQPTIRLGKLVKGLNAVNSPRIQARMMAGCPNIWGADRTAFIRLADDVLRLLSR